jgi:hypothetical protein
VPAYDTVPESEGRIPEWIQETVYTRNTVTVLPACLESVRAIQGRLVQYKNAPEEFMKGEWGMASSLHAFICLNDDWT